MCILTGPVSFVGGTNIFARMVKQGRQVLAYEMTVGAQSDLAMVLPLPVPPDSGDDAVRFVDLSGYPHLFEHLNMAFPKPRSAPQPASLGGAIGGSAPLVVHDVGDFEASFVPHQRHFVRLDARFRLDDSVWNALPDYADYGYAVFKLRGLASAGKRIHPMAFEFPTRQPARLFFPTVHVHDGAVHETAHFDHRLYCQDSVNWLGKPRSGLSHAMDLVSSSGPVGRTVDARRTEGLIAGKLPCYRKPLVGTRRNVDQWIDL